MASRITHTKTVEVNSLVMFKGEQRYAFLYTDENRVKVFRMLGKMAADPKLDFSWYDCAILAKRVREESDKHDTDTDT